MKIANEFTVSAPVEQAWSVLTDLEQVVPLMPGAQAVGWEGDRFLGKLRVKVGPVTSEFAGEAKFVERDETTHRAVIDGRGREARGSGNASALITTQLFPVDGDKTRVTVDTDLKIVGKLAQFGSGMLQQVSEKLLGQFVTSLEAKLAGTDSAAAAQAEGQPAAAAAGGAQESQPVNLAALLGPALWTMIKKYFKAIGVGVMAAGAYGLGRKKKREA